MKGIKGIDGDDTSKKEKIKRIYRYYNPVDSICMTIRRIALSKKIDDAEQREELVMQHFLP